MNFIYNWTQANEDFLELLNRIIAGDDDLRESFFNFLDLGESAVVISMIDDAPAIGTSDRVVHYKINDLLLVCLSAARARDVVTGDA